VFVLVLTGIAAWIVLPRRLAHSLNPFAAGEWLRSRASSLVARPYPAVEKLSDSEQLRVATAQSQSFDEDIDETLVSLGMVTERQLAAARSAQWGYPMLAPGSVGQ